MGGSEDLVCFMLSMNSRVEFACREEWHVQSYEVARYQKKPSRLKSYRNRKYGWPDDKLMA